MKGKPMYPEEEKAVSQMIKNGYVMENELPEVVVSPETQKEMAIPYNTPPKEIKLHKTSLKVLTAELEHIRKSFSNKNGGMRGIPKSVRNRIDRLEKVISFKTEVYKRALEKSNELSSISEDT